MKILRRQFFNTNKTHHYIVDAHSHKSGVIDGFDFDAAGLVGQ